MAKITRYTKDTLGKTMLGISGPFLIFWLVMAGMNAGTSSAAQAIEQSRNAASVWYYLGIPLVSALWGAANHERNPSGPKSKSIVFYLIIGIGLGFVMWMFMFVIRYPDRARELLLGA